MLLPIHRSHAPHASSQERTFIGLHSDVFPHVYGPRSELRFSLWRWGHVGSTTVLLFLSTSCHGDSFRKKFDLSLRFISACMNVILNGPPLIGTPCNNVESSVHRRTIWIYFTVFNHSSSYICLYHNHCLVCDF